MSGKVSILGAMVVLKRQMYSRYVMKRIYQLTIGFFFKLAGSSKTLMLCNLSPLGAHLGETLCSLRFATKVNSTVVGTAKKQVSK